MTTQEELSHTLVENAIKAHKWAMLVSATNAAYEAATPQQRRIMLAKDVIAALDAKRYMAGNIGYHPTIQDEDDPFMERYGEDCRVCAKGAFFVSKLDRGLITNYHPYYHPYYDMSKEPAKYIEEFTPAQLDLIEAAFEHEESFAAETNPVADALRASTFNPDTSLQDRENDLRRIMQNIIDNEGTFIP